MRRRSAYNAGRGASLMQFDNQLHQSIAEVHKVLTGDRPFRQYGHFEKRPHETLRRR